MTTKQQPQRPPTSLLTASIGVLAAAALAAAASLLSCATTPKPNEAPSPVTAAPAATSGGAIVAAPAAAPAPRAVGTPDRDLGLSKGSVFDVAEPRPFAFSKESPGGNDRLPGGYPGAPPRIPHDVTGYLPITLAKNGCLKCHDVEKALTPEDPTPIPQSHHVDLRNAPGVKQAMVAGARWVCTSCHVPQAAVAPPVGNGF